MKRSFNIIRTLVALSLLILGAFLLWNLSTQTAKVLEMPDTGSVAANQIFLPVIEGGDNGDGNEESEIILQAGHPNGEPMTVSVDSKVFVPIHLLPTVPDIRLTVATLQIQFDHTLLEPVACNEDPDQIWSISVCNLEYDLGLLRVSLLSMEGISEESRAANLEFQAIGPAGTASPIKITVANIVNRQQKSVLYTIEEGEVSIQTAEVLEMPDTGSVAANQIFLPVIEGGDNGDGNEESEIILQAGHPNGEPMTVSADGKVLVPIHLLPTVPDIQITVATLQIQFDHTLLEPVTCNENPDQIWSISVCNLEFDVGLLRVSLLSIEGISEESRAANLEFQAIGPAGTASPIKITVVNMVDRQLESVLYTIEESEVSIE